MAMPLPIVQRHLQEDCVLPRILVEQVGRSGGQSHPLGIGVYILDGTYFTVLQRGVFDPVKLFLNLAHFRGVVQKAESWTQARWPV